MLATDNKGLITKMSSSSSSSSSEWESAPVVAKKSLPGPTSKTKTKKVTIAGSKSAKSSTTAKKPTYTTMITQAIIAMKQPKGSSRAAIMKHIAGATTAVPNALLVNKALKKMVEEGILLPGAQAGKSGSGSFKISPAEKARIKQVEKAAARKVPDTNKVAKTAAKTGVKKVSKVKVAAKTKKSVAKPKVNN